MYNDEKTIVKIIKEICSEEKINFKFLSMGYIIELSKNDKVAHIIDNKFDLNGEAGGRIACDKYATYSVLNAQGIPSVEHIMLFNPLTRNNYLNENGNFSIIQNMFSNHNKIVIKPNDGSQGKDVFLCETLKDAETAINKIFFKNDSACVSPFYDSEAEYRTFYIDGEIKIIYKKEKPHIVGDGTSTLNQLIEKLNLPKNSIVKDNLKDVDLGYIPKKDEIIELSWKFNLSGGALPVIIDEVSLKYEKIKELAINAGKALNMRFATIDVLETKENGLMILEINSGVCATKFLEHMPEYYNNIKELYKNAILKMI